MKRLDLSPDKYIKTHAGVLAKGLENYRIWRGYNSGEIYGGVYPRDREGNLIPGINEIDLFVDLTRERLEPYWPVDPEIIEPASLRYPISDMQPPECVSSFCRLVDMVAACALLGGLVYVHCRGGVGRTGTFAVCFLIRWAGFDLDAAECVLRGLRAKDRTRGSWLSPDTEQLDWIVHKYAEIRDARNLKKRLALAS